MTIPRIKSKKDRHQDIVKRICREAGEDGIITGDLYDAYCEWVEEGGEFVVDGECSISKRRFRQWMDQLVREGPIFSMENYRGVRGNTTTFWHRAERDFDDEHIER